MNKTQCCDKCSYTYDFYDGFHKTETKQYGCTYLRCECHQPQTEKCDCETIAGLKAHSMQCVFGKPQQSDWGERWEALCSQYVHGTYSWTVAKKQQAFIETEKQKSYEEGFSDATPND